MSVESSRPTNVVVVAGTATEVGKTWVTARLCERWRRDGWSVAARKPTQSGDPADSRPSDREVLAAATGDDPASVCRDDRCYALPMAPPMAASRLGRPVPTATQILAELDGSWPTERYDIGIVETVGGAGAPIAADLDAASLAHHLGPATVIVVADAGLGTIGAVRANLALLSTEIPLADCLVHLNRFDSADPLHRDNRAWLAGRSQCVVSTDVDTLADLIAERFALFDRNDGHRIDPAHPRTERVLEPARYCPRCGRRLKVVIVPTGHRGRCRWHGEVDAAHHQRPGSA